MYCNFAKTQTQTLPLVFRISSVPKCFKSTQKLDSPSFSNGVCTKPSYGVKPKSSNSNGVFGDCSGINNGVLIKPRNLPNGLHLHSSVQRASLARRHFSNGYPGKAGGNEGGGRCRKTLPWIAAYRNKGPKSSEKVRNEKARRSSWEESAEKLLMKNGAEPQVEIREITSTTLDIAGNSKVGSRTLEGNREVRSRTLDRPMGVAGKVTSRTLERPMGNIKVRSRTLERRLGVGGNSEVESRTLERRLGGEVRSRTLERRMDVAGDREIRTTTLDIVESESGYDQIDGNELVEEVEEKVDDPRWDKIQTRYRRITERVDGFEKPEFRRWSKQENWGRKTWKEATTSTIPRIIGEEVYGVGPVLAALSAARREFYALYVQEGVDLSSNNRKKKDKKGFEKVLKIAEKIGLTIKEAPKHDLNMIVDNRPHQGLVLDASPLEMVSIRELDPVLVERGSSPLWVALDEVTDPQNLGAIIRSSYFFGAAGVVLCAKNSAPLTGVVSKASAGSLELMELRSCKNMMQFLSSSAENGWRVLGGSVSSRAIPLNEVPAGAPTVLVLGSEGTGLRPLVERSCTELVRIPGNIPVDISAHGAEDEKSDEVGHGLGEEFQSFLAVESLNVSVAAGVLLHHLVGNDTNRRLGDKQASAPS